MSISQQIAEGIVNSCSDEEDEINNYCPYLAIAILILILIGVPFLIFWIATLCDTL